MLTGAIRGRKIMTPDAPSKSGFGEVTERLNVPVSKTGRARKGSREFESPPLRFRGSLQRLETADFFNRDSQRGWW